MRHEVNETCDVFGYFWIDIDVEVMKEDANDFLDLIKPESLSAYLESDDTDNIVIDGCEDLGNGFVSIEFSGNVAQEVEVTYQKYVENFSPDSTEAMPYDDVTFVQVEESDANNVDKMLKANIEKLLHEGPMKTYRSHVYVSAPDDDELMEQICY